MDVEAVGKELIDNAIEASSKDRLVEWSSTTVTIEDRLVGIDDDWENVTLLLFDNGNSVDNVNGRDPECSRSPFSPSNADIVIVWIFPPFCTNPPPPFWIVEYCWVALLPAELTTGVISMTDVMEPAGIMSASQSTGEWSMSNVEWSWWSICTAWEAMENGRQTVEEVEPACKVTVSSPSEMHKKCYFFLKNKG